MTAFDRHIIVHSIVDEDANFATWLCNRPSPDANPDGYTNVFWFRVVADRGVLTVTGDFYPTTFTRGPLNPAQCVAWMGLRDPSHSYFMEKASAGSGHECVVSRTAEDALADVQELLDQADKDDEPDWWKSVLRDALEYPCDASDGDVAAELRISIARDAAREAPAASGHAAEVLSGLGERPASHVVLASQALRRLVELLGIELQREDAEG